MEHFDEAVLETSKAVALLASVEAHAQLNDTAVKAGATPHTVTNHQAQSQKSGVTVAIFVDTISNEHELRDVAQLGPNTTWRTQTDRLGGSARKNKVKLFTFLSNK